MTEIIVACIAALAAVSVALIERFRRENRRDHNVVTEKIDALGKSLGISIDRVEQTSLRTEHKLDEHIRDHAKGEFD